MRNTPHRIRLELPTSLAGCVAAAQGSPPRTPNQGNFLVGVRSLSTNHPAIEYGRLPLDQRQDMQSRTLYEMLVIVDNV